MKILSTTGEKVVADTELPVAAALADATANPTTPSVGALLLGYNGTTWDRLRSDTTNGLDVDVTRLPALVAGTALVGKVGIDQTTPGTTNAVSLAQVGATTVATGNGVVGTGVQRVAIASDNTAFPVNAVQSGTWSVTNVSGTISLPTGASTSANQLTEITALQLIDDIVLTEDVAHASGDKGILMLARRADTASSSSGTDGDNSTLNTDANGRLHTTDTRTGASAQNVQGPSAVGASITTGNLFPCGFKDLFGNGVVPTGLDASGVVVLGVLPLDLGLNIQDFSPAGEVYITGLLAHDAVDSGGPIKIGGKAASYAPATSDQPSANKTAVAAGDRTDAALNLFGEYVESVNPYFFTLNNVSTTYNNVTTTATSTAKNCWNYRQASFSYEITKANSPTDILFEVEVSLDGTNYAVMQNDFLGDLRESLASVGTGIKKTVTFPIAAQKIRVKATATGTTASATFIVANACLYLRN